MSIKPKFIKSAIAAIAVIACAGFVGCMKDVSDNNPETDTRGAIDFDFSTKKSVDINLKYTVPAGYRVYYEMYTESPVTLDEYKSYVQDYSLVPFLSGYCDQSGIVSVKGELPASIKEIYAYAFGIGVPTLMKASVGDTGVVSEFKVIDVPQAINSRAGKTPSGTTFWRAYDVTLNKPFLPAVSMVISDSDKQLIDKSFPANQNYDILKTYYGDCIELIGDAKVNIYSVNHAANSNRTNALAYYVYQKETINPKDINSKLNLVFPELTKTAPEEGAGYQLLNEGEETFTAGSRIGFALFPDITPGAIATTNTHLLYSNFETGSWNTYSFPDLIRASVPHMVLSLLRTDNDGHAFIAIGFEDQPWSLSNGTNKGDFRDDIFILEVTPKTSLPGDLPTPPTEEPSYDAEFLSTGIIAFEDCWPAKGDYDINDVVISYERTVCIKNYAVAAMKEKYTLRNYGASFSNGFGSQVMGAKRADVKECKVESTYSCVGQGLDATVDEAIVMLFNDAKHVDVGTTFSVVTTFKENALVTGANPFIVTAGNYSAGFDYLAKDRMEVHFASPKGAMIKYLPTSKAATNLWGTQDDKSLPGSKIYYVREGNYPFALDMNWDVTKYGEVTNFVIPKEGESLEKTYPKFINWVKSNGKTDTDWYLHSNK